MKVFERIRELRAAKDMTQSEFAEALNINRSVMNRIERGTRPIRDDELKAIAAFLGVSTDYLLGSEGTKSSAPASAESQLLQSYRRLQPQNRRIIDHLITALYAQQASGAPPVPVAV